MQDSQELANGLDPEIRLEQGAENAAIDFANLDGIADFSSKKTLKLDEEDSVASNFSGESSTEPSSDCSTSTTQPQNNNIVSCRISKRITWKCHCGHESYDKFLEVRSGAVEEYESVLRHRLNT